ncbi:HNH endonuclease [compost metagenome]
MIYVVNLKDIESALESLGGEGKASQIQQRVLDEFCNGSIPDNYSHARSFKQTIQRKIEDHCPQADGFHRRGYDAKFTRFERGRYRLIDHQQAVIPEEIVSTRIYPEGVAVTISVNTFERNRAAREACIRHHGCKCKACNFDFRETYGSIGAGFIHVHHIIPLATIRQGYQVDPINDLVPLCPNCHAILHAASMTVEDLQREIQTRKSLISNIE